MKRVGLAVAVMALVVLTGSLAFAGRSGNSSTWQLPFEVENGKAHVVAPELGGPVDIVVNLKGLDPNVEYVIKSQAQTVGQGFPNKGGNLNLNGTIVDTQGFGRVNLRDANTNALIDSTDMYIVG
ncbi:MAG TPA: hypothetical protein PLS90_03660 [Candidatus Sumerlaeota bacterium]|nr:MAG: hypothetical protein BWZ08_01865 [candidate division BRC1 bacterium ADurb.BinA292]HOE95580.1 hypothetical protein [Candidatus Sumerlaeota bacterium]HOR28021.1 hypothetical protein [Candidatus Sumerlaeota bacterium]HPK01533.1 hypothetical protein [Candidatus Sumerlaeota bacterium]